MYHSNFSSAENSPFSSPFQSPVVSPMSSRSTSPTRLRRERSPQPQGHVHLKRANSYRKNSRKGISKMDEMIRKRNNLMQRTRSQSDTEVANEESTISDKAAAKQRRREKSVSEDFTDKYKIDQPTSSHPPYSEKSSDHLRPGTPDRKKSLSQMLDLRRLIELSPKLHRLHRSSNHSRSKSNHDADVDSDSPDSGPLFQATTMWVPGYDFKKKQQKPLEERPHSRSFLSRRGSKDKSLMALLGSSSPNLLRRGSKDKLEKQHADHGKGKQKFERRDSSPLANANKSTGAIAKQSLRPCRSDSSEFLSVSERSAILAKRHQDFQDMKKPRNLEPEPPKDIMENGNVKKISHTFEDGSIYVKLTPPNNTAGRKTTSSELSRKISGGEFDNIVRARAESFDSGEAFERKIRRRSYTVMTEFISMPCNRPPMLEERRGSESGYASPTESSEVNTPPQINIIPNDIEEGFVKNKETRRRDGIVWDVTCSTKFKKNLRTSNNAKQNALNIKLTNLCVTEL